MKNYKYFIIVYSVFSLAAVLRIYHLGYNELWFDEVFTYYQTQSVTQLTSDIQGLLFPVLANIWCKVFYFNEFNIRFSALIFGLLSLLFVYKLTKHLFNSKIAFISILLLSISPLHIWYSQEARGYTLYLFLSITSIYYLLKALENETFKCWIIFAVITVLNFCAYYASLLLLVPEGLFVLLYYRKFFKKWILYSSGVIGVAIILYILYLKKSIGFYIYETGFWLPKLMFGSIINVFDNFNLGYNGSIPSYIFMRVISFVFMGLGIIKMWFITKRSTIICCLFLFITLMTNILISIVSNRSIFLTRMFFNILPFYIIFVAAGIYSIRNNTIKTLVVISYLCISLGSINNYFLNIMPAPINFHIGVHLKKPISPLVNYIKGFNKEEILVGHTCVSTTLPYKYYYERNNKGPLKYEKIPYFFIPESNNKNKDYWDRFFVSNIRKGEEEDLIKGVNLNLIEEGVSSFPSQFWVLFSSWDKDGELDKNSTRVLKWFKKRFYCHITKQYKGILFVLFYKRN